jgi:hypothetical protein
MIARAQGWTSARPAGLPGVRSFVVPDHGAQGGAHGSALRSTRPRLQADWIGGPDRLKALARRHKFNDLFTVELVAWCAEVHE